MNWIRIATGILSDPAIHAVADAAKISVPTAVGHVVGVLTALPDHARTGDLSAIGDTTLELWAMWTGKRGTFAAAFRAHLCDAAGVVRAWERHNGAAIREADRAKERVKEWRDDKKAARNVRGTEPVTSAVTNGDRTRLRDGTGRDVTTSPLTGEVVSAREPDERPAGGRVAYRQQLDELRAAGMPHERAALDALVRAHPSPDVLVLELHAIASGLHVVRGEHTGRAADIADVMRAVAEMAAGAKPFSVSLFRGFCRRVADRPPEPPSAEEREAARLAREIAARQPAVAIEAPRTQDEIERLRAQREAAMAQFRAEFKKYNPQGIAA